ncbi:MAG: TolC family protein, partial [Tepidisphaeraceae bacterium]
PSELLRRRPDVRAAERQIEAATASIGVATADLFPKFSLNGAVGLSSAKFTNLPNSGSVFYSIGPSVSWRLFDAGQILANIRVQDAVQEQALLTYRQTVLQAFSEVEDTLIAYDREQARRIALQRTVDASRRALDLARQLNDAGVVDFLNVLTAQQSLYQAENDLAVSDQTVSTNLVALYKALGGGWETTDVQPLIESAHGKH